MSNKHKHYEMIVAKAANMDLVVFRKNYDDSWGEVECHDCTFMPDFDYFLCLPQHKEACLHWLNGGKAEENYKSEWSDIEHHEWHDQSVFNFDDGYTIRIKPKKEKRWIVIHNGKLVNELFKSDTDIRMSYLSEYATLQRFQIEVEV